MQETAQHWQFIIEHEHAIRAQLSRVRGGNVDDLWSEVVLDRIASIVENYDPFHPSGASLKHHCLRNLYLYACKHVAKRYNRLAKHVELQEYFGQVTDNDDLQLVQVLLGKLSKEHSAILFMRHYQCLGYKEIGQHLGVGRGMARLKYSLALRAARKYLTQQGIDEL